jgi:hypothetical protein
MASTLGTLLPRQRTGHLYLFAALGLAGIFSIGAFRGKYGWDLTECALGIAAFLYTIPYFSARGRENVQVDDNGVIVVTDKGRDEVLWADVTRALIITTSRRPVERGRLFRARKRNGQGLRCSS